MGLEEAGAGWTDGAEHTSALCCISPLRRRQEGVVFDLLLGSIFFSPVYRPSCYAACSASHCTDKQLIEKACFSVSPLNKSLSCPEPLYGLQLQFVFLIS